MEDRQTQTEVARWRRSRLEENVYKNMEAHSKIQNGIGRHRKGGKGSARAVEPDSSILASFVHTVKYLLSLIK
jgi:hypothetical protein